MKAGEWGGAGGCKDFAPDGAVNRRAEQRVDNSPAIHGWVKRPSNQKSREGRQDGSFVPSGTLENCGPRIPAMNGWAIFRAARNAFSVNEFWERFPRVGAPRLPARNANPGLMDLNPVGIQAEG
jgi:hypothetical protein